MTNNLAIILGLFVIGLLALDALVFGSTNTLFLARRFADLLGWMAFWR